MVDVMSTGSRCGGGRRIGRRAAVGATAVGDDVDLGSCPGRSALRRLEPVTGALSCERRWTVAMATAMAGVRMVTAANVYGVEASGGRGRLFPVGVGGGGVALGARTGRFPRPVTAGPRAPAVGA